MQPNGPGSRLRVAEPRRSATVMAVIHAALTPAFTPLGSGQRGHLGSVMTNAT